MNILDVIFPRWCIGCGRRLVSGERYLCLHCMAGLPRTGFWKHPEDNKLVKMYYSIPFVDKAAAYTKYDRDGLTSIIVKTFKYRTQRDLARYSGRLMAHEMDSTGFFVGIDAIVPVPLTFRRRMWRGYNQSEYLAKGISDVTGIPVCTNLLKRKNFHKSQTTLYVWERLKNVEHAFTLNSKEKEGYCGKHLLLVDDVITIGATTKACCEALSKITNLTVSIVSFASARYK